MHQARIPRLQEDWVASERNRINQPTAPTKRFKIEALFYAKHLPLSR